MGALALNEIFRQSNNIEAKAGLLRIIKGLPADFEEDDLEALKEQNLKDLPNNS